jgi:tRNA 5-methylaminomethyl-2-thiouridine biosynthesis bifunctional protein
MTGRALSTAPVLVLCNAADALRLLGRPPTLLTPVRGQLSWCHSEAQAQALGWPAEGPHQPVAGAGYALRTASQWLWGATSHVGDLDPAVREHDHVGNLVQWARLRGETVDEHSAQARIARAQVEGRVGWRWTTPDKLPLWGGIPAGLHGHEQVRHAPRIPGLWICTGLGSRGITWSALAGQVMAALISDTVCPLESSLLDAVDPARWRWPDESAS